MRIALTVAIGLMAGFLSGTFGIGGSIISTPALRLILKVGPLIAVGTPLPVIIPTAISGGWAYYKKGLVNFGVALWAALGGILGTSVGSFATYYISGHVLMLVTAVLIGYLGLDFMSKSILRKKVSRPVRSQEASNVKTVAKRHEIQREQNKAVLAQDSNQSEIHALPVFAIGIGAGLVSGLLGIGGGILLIPAFLKILKMPLKESFGTSLVVVSLIAVPGSIIHYYLGHVDLWIAIFLSAGVILGANLGARFSIRTRESVLVLLFGLFLIVTASVFGYLEILSMISG